MIPAWYTIALLLTLGISHAETRIRLPAEEGTDLLFRRVTFEDASTHATVTQILQDRAGFMWFGTTDGLKRYDGYRIRDFHPEAGGPASLSGLDIRTIFEDRSGKLWIGCDLTVDRYDPVNESFTHFPADVLEGPVHHIAADPSGLILFSGAHGLAGFDPATGKFERYRDATNILRSTLVQRNGTLWMTDKEGISIFDRHSGEVRLRIPLRDPAAMRTGRSANLSVVMIEDHAGVLWVASERDGLAKVDIEHRQLEYLELGGGTADQGVRAIAEDQEGALWIGSNAAGLFKLDRDRKKLVRYRNRPDDPDSLSSDRIRALAADRSGGMWAGTEGGSAVRFQSRPITMHSYAVPGGKNSIVSAAYVDSQKNLWIGSRGFIHRIGRGGGSAVSFALGGAHAGLASSDVRSIAEDREGHIWAAVWGGGLHRYDPRTGRWRIFRHNDADPFSINHDSVFAVLVDHRGRVWAGTEDGLDLFDADSGRFTVYRVPGIGANRERAIAEDAHGVLWLATLYTGLHRFDPETGKFTVYRHSDRQGDLSNDALTSVCVDPAGIVWVGSAAGLNRYDPATQKFAVFTERNGLADDGVKGVLEDPRGGLWITTSRGLSHYNPAGELFENFDRSDGFPNDLTSVWPGMGGEILAGSYDGLIAFVPPQAPPAKPPAPVALTKFELSDLPVSIGGGSPLKQSISYTRELTLSHRDRVFSLEFAALNFENPERTRYRYMLQNFEHDWIQVDAAARVARYTALAPGTYKFRVQSSSGRDQWRGDAATIIITILPAWWASWQFRCAVVLALGSAIWVAYRIRVRHVAARLNSRFEERLAERVRIAGDLHDTLLQDVIGASMQLDVAVESLPDHSPLKGKLEHVLRMMARAVDDGRNAVRGLRSRDSRSLRLEQAFARIKQEFAGGQVEEIEFRVSVDGRPRPLHPIFHDEVYRIGREALINAIQHAQAKNIEVELEYSHRRFKLSVRDDGRGIEPNLLQTGKAGHWGLTGMRERADRIGAHLQVLTHPSRGTRVEISAPAKIAFSATQAPPRGGLSGISLARGILRLFRSITRSG